MSKPTFTRLEPYDRLRLSVVTSDAAVESAVRIACPPPHEILPFPLEGLVDQQLALSDAGKRIVDAATGCHAVLVAWQFDLAPMINTLCYHVRRAMLVPVIALCRSGNEEQVAAVAAGADDTLTFPLYVPLLHARLVAYHRIAEAARVLGAQSVSTPAPEHEVRRFGPLRLDRSAHRFFVRNEEVELTPREFSLLDYLIEHAEVLCTRDQILDHVWGINFDTGTNMVDVYMYFLRRKLEARGIRGIIQTVRGYGYRLVRAESTASS
jgi:DNA-binding response OmpR family regulator